jgi:hypothetical protein
LLSRVLPFFIAASCGASALVGLAPANAALAAEPSAGRVVASMKLPAGSSEVQVARGGRYAVVLTNHGRHKTLTKYQLGARSVTRLGSTSWVLKYDAPQVLRLSPGSAAAAYVYDDSYLMTFDLSHRAPRRVARIPTWKLEVYSGPIVDLAFAPDGRRAYAMTRYGVRTHDTRRPTRPVPGAETRVDIALPGDDSGFLTKTGTVTRDGQRLVLGGYVYGSDVDDGDGRFAQIAVCDLDPATGVPTVVRRERITAAGWSDAYTNVAKLAVSDDPDEIYAGVVAEGGPDEIMVARVRLADLSVTDQLSRNGRFQQRLTTTRSGSRLYFTEGVRRSRPPYRMVDQRLKWTGPGLGTRHSVASRGPVMDFAVSQGGVTQGMVYVVSGRPGHLRLSVVRAS